MFLEMHCYCTLMIIESEWMPSEVASPVVP